MIVASSQPNSLLLKSEGGLVESLTFTPPQVGSQTVIRVVNGVTEQQKTPINEPFSAVIKLAKSSPGEVLAQLGLQKNPEGSVIVEIKQSSADAQISVRSKYQEWRKVPEEVSTYVRTIYAGDEVAPYCRASETRDVYDTETVMVDRLVPDTECRVFSLKEQNVFTVLVASLVLAKSSEARALLDFLIERFPEQSKIAEQQIRNRGTQRVEQLRLAAEETSRGLSGFSLLGMAA